jgi:hypothetical protein
LAAGDTARHAEGRLASLMATHARCEAAAAEKEKERSVLELRHAAVSEALRGRVTEIDALSTAVSTHEETNSRLQSAAMVVCIETPIGD